MTEFAREDVNALFSLVPLVFWQLYNPPVNRNYGEAYELERKKHQVGLAPPAWVFPVAWTLVYGLIIASGFIFFREYHDGNAFYLATAIIYLVNIMLNKYWSVVFFRGTVNARRYALLILIVLLLTGGAVVILQFEAGARLPASLYLGYVAWLCFAFVLNIKWLSIPPYVPGKIPQQQQQQQKQKVYKSMRSAQPSVRSQKTTVTTTRTFTTSDRQKGLPRFVTKN